MKDSLTKLFELRLDKLAKEMSLYNSEADLWKTAPNISNSGGNLCLHLIGNLNHFVGAVLGQTGYVRKRDEEFSVKNIPLSEMKTQIENTKKVILRTISNLSQSDFEAVYPINVFGTEMTTTYFLIHLSGHLNYHLGQINYHRRLLC